MVVNASPQIAPHTPAGWSGTDIHGPPGWLSWRTGSSPRRRPAGRGLQSGPPLTVREAATHPTVPPASLTLSPYLQTSPVLGIVLCRQLVQANTWEWIRRGRWCPCPRPSKQQVQQVVLHLRLCITGLHLRVYRCMFPVHCSDLPEHLIQRRHRLKPLQLCYNVCWSAEFSWAPM